MLTSETEKIVKSIAKYEDFLKPHTSTIRSSVDSTLQSQRNANYRLNSLSALQDSRSTLDKFADPLEKTKITKEERLKRK